MATLSVRIIWGLFILVPSFLSLSVSAQQPAQADNNRAIILNGDSTPKPDPLELSYIGEIRQHSYIKITLRPVEGTGSENPTTEKRSLQKYKGEYYEAVNGRTYKVEALFDSETRNWTIKCYNDKKQYVAYFQGRETLDETIEGSWKTKKRSLPFYLLRKSFQE